MKNAISFLLVFTATIFSLSALQWEIISLDNEVYLPSGSKFEIHAFEMEKAGDNYFAVDIPGNFASIIKSSNNGISWDTCFWTGENMTIYNLYVKNNKIFALADSGLIYRSTDYGNSWEKNFLGEKYNHPIQHIEFINDSVGFLGHINDVLLLKTTNGGRTWDELPNSGDLPKIFGMRDFVAISEDEIYFTGGWQGELFIYGTTDGGNNWELLNSDVEYLNLHYFNNQFYIFKDDVFQENNKGRGYLKVLRSKDCKNWEEIFRSDTVGGFRSVNVAKMFNDTIIGMGHKVFMLSFDGGETWEDLYTEEEEFFQQLNTTWGFIYEDQKITAQKISNNLFYRYDFNTTSVVSKENSEIILYPNPTTDKINIGLEEIKSVSVYNLQMQEVKAIDNIGTNTIDLTEQPPGVYFLEVVGISGNVYFEKIIKR